MCQEPLYTGEKIIESIICSFDLVKRWECHPQDIYKLVVQGGLTAYRYSRKALDGKTVVFLPGASVNSEDIAAVEGPDGTVCFDLKVVESIECCKTIFKKPKQYQGLCVSRWSRGVDFGRNSIETSIPTCGAAVIMEHIITPEELLARWTGEDESTIASIVGHSDGVPAYWLLSSRIDPETNKVKYFCTPPWAAPKTHNSGTEIVYDWEGIVFKEEDIHNFERIHPEVTWKIATQSAQQDDEWIVAEDAREALGLSPNRMVDELLQRRLESNVEPEFRDHLNSVAFPLENPFFTVEMLPKIKIHRSSFEAYKRNGERGWDADEQEKSECSNLKNTRGDDGEWIPADSVRKALNLSPAKFTCFLEKGNLETDREWEFQEHKALSFYQQYEPFFCPDDIKKLRIYKQSWLDYCQKNKIASMIPPLPTISQQAVVLAKKRIAELEAQLESAKQRITELEAQLGDANQGVDEECADRTQKASEAKQQSVAEKWKGYSACMVKVALECEREGPQKRTRPQLETIANRYGGLNKTALDLLRDALPDEHVNRIGGPGEQS
ncbi:MAG: hypothetical protein AB7D07_14855 [Desulfovibrionaceae bacterium]